MKFWVEVDSEKSTPEDVMYPWTFAEGVMCEGLQRIWLMMRSVYAVPPCWSYERQMLVTYEPSCAFAHS